MAYGYGYYVEVLEDCSIGNYDSDEYAVFDIDKKVHIDTDLPLPFDTTGYKVVDIVDGFGTLLTPDKARIRELEMENEALKQEIAAATERMDITETALLEISDAVLSFKGGE